MTHIEEDDITAMRTQGDLKGFMRSLIRPTNTRRTEPVPQHTNRWGDMPIPPDHTPGTWPPGTHPPGPPPEWSQPKHLWNAAVRHYRNETHRPDQPCDCGNCPPQTPKGEPG